MSLFLLRSLKSSGGAVVLRLEAPKSTWIMPSGTFSMADSSLHQTDGLKDFMIPTSTFTFHPCFVLISFGLLVA